MPTLSQLQELINEIGPNANYSGQAMRNLLAQMLDYLNTNYPTLQKVSETGGFTNGSALVPGSFNNGGGGGISEICDAGFEKNFQTGRVKMIHPVSGPNRAVPIQNDSAQKYLGQPFSDLTNASDSDTITASVNVLFAGDLSEQFNSTFTDNGIYRIYLYDGSGVLLGIAKFDGANFDGTNTTLYLYSITNILSGSTINQIVKIIGYEFGEDTLITKKEALRLFPVAETGLTSKGQNYVIVQSVNTGNPAGDALTNGVNLLAALAELNTFDWGTRSLDNIGSLLLMPGTYDLNDQTIQMVNFINIVGVSTNRRDTIITASGMLADQIHISWGPNVTAGLQNVELIADVANGAIMLGGDDTSFPIVENVYMGSDMIFSNDGGTCGFNNLVGSWKDIEFQSTKFAFIAKNDINATFKNIIVGNLTKYIFYSDNDILGNIENVVGKIISSSIIYANNNISASITNLNANGNIYTSGGVFNGKLINSTINSIGIGISINNLGNGAIIENCKILSDSGAFSIAASLPVFAQILYTITNNGIDSNITVPSVNYNINDSTIV
jgi:hypothetical protein